jgi:hypothetical protein
VININPSCLGEDGRGEHGREQQVGAGAARRQGRTLVHCSAQLKRILWDRGAMRGCSEGVWEVSGGIQEYQGVFRVYFVSDTAYVELRSGRL